MHVHIAVGFTGAYVQSWRLTVAQGWGMIDTCSKGSATMGVHTLVGFVNVEV